MENRCDYNVLQAVPRKRKSVRDSVVDPHNKVLKKKRFMWKGKVVTKSVYEQRLAQSRTGRTNSKKQETEQFGEKQETETDISSSQICEKEINSDELHEDAEKLAEGRRIVDLYFLGTQLWCTFCKECLSLENIESEQRRGLGSSLLVRCHKCLLINSIVTGKQHSPKESSRRNSRFDINTKLTVGQ